MVRGLTDKQEAIMAYIGDFVQLKGYPPTVREIGAHFKIASSSVFDHLQALTEKGVLRRRAGKSRSIELIGPKLSAGPSQHSAARPDFEAVEIISVPLLGQVAAGKPLLAVENIEEMIQVPRQWARSGQIFALRVRGDSMINDGIHEGDCVLVRMQSQASNGDIVVALLEDEATVKRFYQKTHCICLRAANLNYPDILTTQAKILGKVIGLFRSYAQ